MENHEMFARLNEDIEKLSNDLLKSFEESRSNVMEFSTPTKQVYVELLESEELSVHIKDKN